MDRRIFLSFPFALLLLGRAWAQTDDVQACGREIDAMLRAGLNAASAARDEQARRAAIKAFLLTHADLKRVARFVLGRSARTASPDDFAAFEQAFTEALTMNVADALDGVSNASLRFVQAVARTPQDVIVSYTIGSASRVKHAAVRALRPERRWRIVDVEADGVWLAILQQRQIAAMLDEPGATIATVTARIKAHSAAG